MRIDARGEWLSVNSVKQAENLWVNQLLHSKDVVAQTEAVTGVSVCGSACVHICCVRDCKRFRKCAHQKCL